MSAANLLTTLRLVLTAPIIILMYTDGPAAAWCAFGLFLFAMLTDVFDGRLARRNPNRSPLGTYLDPLADKVLLMSLFICLADQDIVPAWMVVVLVAREFIVNGVRSAGAAQGKVVGANWMGKTKTFLQTVAISAALLGNAFARGSQPRWVLHTVAWGTTLVVTAAAAAFALAFVYWNRALFSKNDKH